MERKRRETCNHQPSSDQQPISEMYTFTRPQTTSHQNNHNDNVTLHTHTQTQNDKPSHPHRLARPQLVPPRRPRLTINQQANMFKQQTTKQFKNPSDPTHTHTAKHNHATTKPPCELTHTTMKCACSALRCFSLRPALPGCSQ